MRSHGRIDRRPVTEVTGIRCGSTETGGVMPPASAYKMQLTAEQYDTLNVFELAAEAGEGHLWGAVLRVSTVL
jgi:hypothetical protein